MLSVSRARPAPLLLLFTSVLSETLAAQGDHISFVVGLFRPRFFWCVPLTLLEPRGLSRSPSRESVEPARDPRGHLGNRVASAAADSRLRHPFSKPVAARGRGWPRLRCAYRALALAVALVAWVDLGAGGCSAPPIEGLRARTRVSPSFSALPPLPPPPPLGRPVIGTDRNSESFSSPKEQTHFRPSAGRGLGEGSWGGGRGGGSRQTGNISPLGPARFCVRPPLLPLPSSPLRPLGRRSPPGLSVTTFGTSRARSEERLFRLFKKKKKTSFGIPGSAEADDH